MAMELLILKKQTESDRKALSSSSDLADAETQDCSSAADEEDFRAKMEAFLNYEPAYTAQEFEDKVCAELAQIQRKYAEAETKLEDAIKVTEKTIRTCKNGINKIDRQHRIDTEMLNSAFCKIGLAVAQEVASSAFDA